MKTNNLSEYSRGDLVIYDFNVIVFQILNTIQQTDISPEKLETIVKLHIVFLFNRGPTADDYFNHKRIIVDDSKPYWRNTLYPDYKGNRPPKPELRNTIRNLALRYLNSKGASIFSKDGYEADDFAGSFVRLYHLIRLTNKTKVLPRLSLLTVDSDWLQLVNDDLGITWYNTGPWTPRIRDEEQAVLWARRKLSELIQSPQDIVAIKCIKGDSSDNLPPGSDPELIDLINTPNQYRLTTDLDFVNKALDIINKPIADSDYNALLESRKLLNRNCLEPIA